jgi:regulator of protease activity HflC (stomatin/prohibitin superfamily)
LFDRLVDLLIGCIDLFRFWCVIPEYERGVLLRLGKFVRECEPGFHWVLPFSIDHVIAQVVVPSTHSLGHESVTTKDGKAITFHAVCTYSIRDIRKALLEVEDVNHAVRDACSGEIGRVLHEATWEEIIGGEIMDKATAACRKRGFRFGIEVTSVQFASMSLTRNLRIFGST